VRNGLAQHAEGVQPLELILHGYNRQVNYGGLQAGKARAGPGLPSRPLLAPGRFHDRCWEQPKHPTRELRVTPVYDQESAWRYCFCWNLVRS